MSETVEKRALVPKLRFPGFEDVWTRERFDDVYRFGTTFSISRDMLNYEDGKVRVVHYGDIHTKYPSHADFNTIVAPFLTDVEGDFNSKDFCEAGDILFADASEDLQDVGKALEVMKLPSVPLLSGMHTIHAHRRSQRPELGFGGYLFASRFTKQQIQNEAQGTKVFGISESRLGRIDLPLPTSAREQRKIADCLQSLDELIAAQTEKLEALRRYKKGLLQQLFPAEGETIPRLRFPQFREADDWQDGSIADIGKVVTGTTPTTTRREFYGHDIPFVSPADISDDHFVTSAKSGLTILGATYARVVPAGSTFFVCIGSTIGKLAQCSVESATNQQINSVVPNTKRFDPGFVYYLLSTQVDTVRQIAGKQAVPLVNKTDFSSVPVLFPLIEEQRSISLLLSELDNAQNATSHNIATLRSHKAALMQQLFPHVEELE